MYFWNKLKKPFFALAPMEGVTDTVFRRIVAECAAPDVFFTEFTSTDGMVSAGKKRVMDRLEFTEAERPLVAQIWGNTPEHYEQAAQTIEKMGFDGIDINMGCPVNKVVKHGYCSGLIKNPKLAQKLIKTTKKAVKHIPVSVKTRIGYDKVETEEWISAILETNPAVITIHGRTTKQMSQVPAQWEEIAKAVKLRDRLNKDVLIVGNGDILSYQQGLDYAKTYGIDGIMVGRGVLQNIWIFDPRINPATIPFQARKELLMKHITLFHLTWGNGVHFDRMKKYYKIYLSGMPHAAQLRNDLMQYHTAEETLEHLNSIEL